MSEKVQNPETVVILEKKSSLWTPRRKKIAIITASVVAVLVAAKVICSQTPALDADPAPETDPTIEA